MQIETDQGEIIERVAALDVSKAEVVCCARVPGPGGRRMQEVRTVSTMTAALLALGDWLAGLGVTRVVMEATSDYWRAPFYLLEDRFSDLAGQRPRRQAPARPAQDRPARRGVAVQGRRAADAAPVLRAAPGDPGPARLDPLPDGPARRPHGGEAAGGEAARGRADQALDGGQRPVRGLRAGDHGRTHRRRARSGGAGRSRPRQPAVQDGSSERGADRPVHRAPRLSADPDAPPGGCTHRRHRPPCRPASRAN
jgi:hypothetical protein